MTSHRQPAVFAGHGSPMYAIEPNRYTASWTTFSKSLKRPDAILVISAHWVTRGVWLTAMPKPKTIHDFGGFPQALFDIQYPAPGSPALADRVKELLDIPVVLEENEWGIDHGAWCVLRYLYPEADIPVVQLSLDGSLSAQKHFELATKLRPLRDENILILASGNVVHNLRTIHWEDDATPYPWAKKFNDFFISEMKAGHHQTLIDWEQFGDAAHLSIPTPEHYWPALYVLALKEEGETPRVLVDGIEMSSISMLTFSIQ
jgi:4,5-DOPA dioxygenase extradiol